MRHGGGGVNSDGGQEVEMESQSMEETAGESALYRVQFQDVKNPVSSPTRL